MHRRNSHSPLVAVCGGISWAASSLGKVRFFLGGGGLGPQRGGSSVKVSTKGGGPYPLFQLFKGRVTYLFQNF